MRVFSMPQFTLFCLKWSGVMSQKAINIACHVGTYTQRKNCRVALDMDYCVLIRPYIRHGLYTAEFISWIITVIPSASIVISLFYKEIFTIWFLCFLLLINIACVWCVTVLTLFFQRSIIIHQGNKALIVSGDFLLIVIISSKYTWIYIIIILNRNMLCYYSQ